MSEIREIGVGSVTVTRDSIHSEVKEISGPGFVKIREAYEGAKETIKGLNRQIEELSKENEKLKKQMEASKEIIYAPNTPTEDNTPPRGVKKVTTKRRDY